MCSGRVSEMSQCKATASRRCRVDVWKWRMSWEPSWNLNPQNTCIGARYAARACFWASPINISAILRDRLFSRVDSAILTSATLSTGGNFLFVKSRLGLEQANELIVPSPVRFRQPGHFLCSSGHTGAAGRRLGATCLQGARDDTLAPAKAEPSFFLRAIVKWNRCTSRSKVI